MAWFDAAVRELIALQRDDYQGLMTVLAAVDALNVAQEPGRAA
jgi:hypothetical protein